MATSLLSQSEMDYIKAGCLDDCRADGRTCTEFRPHAVLVPSSSSLLPPTSSLLLVRSNGSARVLVDNHADLLCSVKADIVRPPASRPDRGIVEVSVEYHPASSAGTGDAGGSKRSRSNDEEELQQLLEDLWLPHLVDLSRLCLLEGEHAWRLSVDVVVLSSGGAGASAAPAASSAGCLLDAAALAVRAALRNTWLPSVAVIPRHDQGEAPVGTRPAATGTATAELAVEGDIAKARPLVLLDGSGDGSESGGSLNLVTVTLLKCYRTNASSLDAPPSAQFVCVMDASGDEVGCSVCQVHVTVRTKKRNNRHPTGGPTDDGLPSSPPPPSSTSHICALQTSGSGGSIPVSLLSEVSRLAIQAVEAQRTSCRVTDLSHSSFLPETMLLQEAYALQ
jgi:exosome complex RNA-binding protein Rrp42 (RNase PH superfamily)